MKITKITLYNVPFRYSTQDRIIENVDTKIERWKKDTIVATIDTDGNALFDTVAYDITNGFEGSITINSTNRYNYARLETDLYGTKPVYVFLHALKSIESSTGFSYNIKIDVMASFGKELFDKMNGKNVLIDRMHEDRYKIETNTVKPNYDNHALLNSDFSFKDSYGQKIIYGGSGVAVRTETGSTVYDDAFQGRAYPLQLSATFATSGDPLDIQINNTIIKDKKQYYTYAILTSTGEPSAKQTLFPNNIKSDTWIAPIDMYNSQVGFRMNQLDLFEELQEGKLLSIIYSPFQLISNTQSFKWLCKIFARKGNSWVLIDKRVDLFEQTGSGGAYTHDAAIAVMPLGDSLGITTSFNNVELQRLIDTIFKPSVTQTELSQMRNGSYTTSIQHEIGLLGKDIVEIVIDYNNNQNNLDVVNYLSNPYLNNSQYIGNQNIQFSLTEEGVNARVILSQMQSFDIQESNMLSFYTKAGSTYLAQNASYLNAQKRGVELQADLQKTQVKSQRFQSGAAAANPISAIMSLGTSLIGNAGAAAYSTQELGEISKITDNEKAKIDAHIQDMNNTSPYKHGGSDKSFAWMNSGVLRYKLNFIAKMPNDKLLKKVYYFIQKHGYKIDDWMTFTPDVYNSREKWNMLTIKQALDYIPQTDYDDSIITEFAARLENGVRIWHKDDFIIDYTLGNVETKLLQHFNIS